MKARKRIGLQQVRTLAQNQTIWDAAVTGFGARRQRSDAVAYVLQYRTRQGRTRLYTIGRHGAPWTPDAAREEAKRLLGRIVMGEDPAATKQTERNAKTVAELCDAYMAEVEAGRLLTRRKRPKKSSTLITDRGRIERHVKPLLGSLAVADISRSDVEGFMHDVAIGKTAKKTKTKLRGLANVRGGKGTATRTLGLLGAIFGYAVRHQIRHDNPVHGVVRFADGRRLRRLTEAEYMAFGGAVRVAEAEGAWPALLAAVRFLILTGWRRGEVLGLRWQEVDLDRRTVRLTETKTGESLRPLAHRACDILRGIPRFNELVFCATRGGGRMTGFPKMWKKIFADGRLPSDVTPHVLRHSYASLASDMGLSEATIAALVGHKQHSMTSRYVHSADALLLSAADRVADEIAMRMGEALPQAAVVQLNLVRSG